MSRSHDVTISGFDLDRLEAELARVKSERDETRAECAEQARLLGMSAEREAALRGELERIRMSDKDYVVGKIEFAPSWSDELNVELNAAGIDSITGEKKKLYPDWVCQECGETYGRGMPEGHIATWHDGECGICGNYTTVTEPRDYRHLKQWPIKEAVK